MSKNTFENIYKSVQGLEAGSSVTFNGFPMVVESQTTTLNRYYGELRWVNQLDGKLDIDVTLRVGINFFSEQLTEAWVDKKMQEDRDFLLAQVSALQAENERLRKAGDAMADTLIPWDFEHLKNEDKPLWAFEVSLLDAWLKAKGGQS